MTKNGRSDTADVTARHRANLGAFVLRARRVASHSLARDWDVLVALTGGPKAAGESGYQVMIGDSATGETAELDDRRLATAWIYGDVVHHDLRLRQEADPFGLSERFRAVVPLVTWAMVTAIELLNYIRVLQDAGILGLRPEVFDQEVVLTSTLWEHTGRVCSAPVGTPAPVDALAPFGTEWTPLSAPDPRRADH
jgi:hypothetical protein